MVSVRVAYNLISTDHIAGRSHRQQTILGLTISTTYQTILVTHSIRMDLKKFNYTKLHHQKKVLKEPYNLCCNLPPKIEVPSGARIERRRHERRRGSRVRGGGNFLLFNLEMMYFGAHLRYSDVLIIGLLGFNSAYLLLQPKCLGGKAELWGVHLPLPQRRTAPALLCCIFYECKLTHSNSRANT